ncbi:vanadium-dependent haloperoxidase [Saccharothrix syringae]|uniref:Phosphoesterase n=1 Tax=Saccharothrix syringae TaxID=103733 RepID=A0A5Q0GXV2_SACSY|nr:vanadium-dependent haloperoxidase [Saccharothrix syringae]QFZ18320.1 phosphoesterase [Saccharothrix syringae]
MRSRSSRFRPGTAGVLAAALALGLPLAPAVARAAPAAAAAPNVVIRWSNAGMAAVSRSTMGPPMVARAYAVLHTCIYDAWAAYDARAAGTLFGNGLRRPVAERTAANKDEAISHAAYTAAVDVWPEYKADFDALMAALGYRPGSTSTPAWVGRRACGAVLDYRHRDGSNQLGDIAPGAYADYTGYAPVNRPMDIYQPLVPSTVQDVNRWQPLSYRVGDQVVTQTGTGPHWRHVTPFAMTSWDQFTGGLAPPARYGTVQFEQQAQQLIDYGADLDDRRKVVTEYWADDFPGTPRPPGRWLVIGQYVSTRDAHTVDDDAKMLFAVANAVFDASIACWGVKYQYDSVRPITAIRYLNRAKQIPSWARAGTGPELINGDTWLPYQPAVLMTPSFGDYVSGHSTFGAAAAEVFKSFTGSDAYGETLLYPRGASKVEPGLTPGRDITLSWSTFTEAEAENGISRLYGGIHFQAANQNGRVLGRQVGANAWAKAAKFFDGVASP